MDRSLIIGFDGKLISHLLTNNVIQVRDTDISFDKRDLIHLLREGPLFHIVLNPHIIVGCWTAFRNKHLLREGRRKQIYNRDVLSDVVLQV